VGRSEKLIQVALALEFPHLLLHYIVHLPHLFVQQQRSRLNVSLLCGELLLHERVFHRRHSVETPLEIRDSSCVAKGAGRHAFGLDQGLDEGVA